MYSIFDSASNTIQVPPEIFDDYMNAFFLEVGKSIDDSYVEGQGVYVPCGPAYPDLHFLFDRVWLQVNPEDYVRDISADGDGSQCMLLITKGQTPFLIMGLPLFKGYYSVHDDTAGRIGFVPHSGSTKNGPYFAASYPTIDLRDAVERTDYDDVTSHDSYQN